MADFEANILNAQQRLGRRLTTQEVQLLQLWDSLTQSDSRDLHQAVEQRIDDESPQEPQDEVPPGFFSAKAKLVLLAALVLVAFLVWMIFVTK